MVSLVQPKTTPPSCVLVRFRDEKLALDWAICGKPATHINNANQRGWNRTDQVMNKQNAIQELEHTKNGKINACDELPLRSKESHNPISQKNRTWKSGDQTSIEMINKNPKAKANYSKPKMAVDLRLTCLNPARGRENSKISETALKMERHYLSPNDRPKVTDWVPNFKIYIYHYQPTTYSILLTFNP